METNDEHVALAGNLDPAHTLLSRAVRANVPLSDSLAEADSATRAGAMRRLQSSSGNASVQRLVERPPPETKSASKPSPSEESPNQAKATSLASKFKSALGIPSQDLQIKAEKGAVRIRATGLTTTLPVFQQKKDLLKPGVAGPTGASPQGVATEGTPTWNGTVGFSITEGAWTVKGMLSPGQEGSWQLTLSSADRPGVLEDGLPTGLLQQGIALLQELVPVLVQSGDARASRDALKARIEATRPSVKEQVEKALEEAKRAYTAGGKPDGEAAAPPASGQEAAADPEVRQAAREGKELEAGVVIKLE